MLLVAFSLFLALASADPLSQVEMFAFSIYNIYLCAVMHIQSFILDFWFAM